MSNHTTSTSHDSTMAIPGHNSHLVHVHETRETGLHCGGELDGCGWYAGSGVGRRERWAEKHMRDAWQRHVDFVQAGGVIRHGRAANVDEGVCHCASCAIVSRMAKNAAETGRLPGCTCEGNYTAPGCPHHGDPKAEGRLDGCVCALFERRVFWVIAGCPHHGDQVGSVTRG
jgi:hypothetical protein